MRNRGFWILCQRLSQLHYLKIYLFFMLCLGVLDCMYIRYYVHIVPIQARRGRWSPETGATDSRELLFECWEPNSGPLQEKYWLLTAEPSLLSSLTRTLTLTFWGWVFKFTSLLPCLICPES